MHTCNFSSTLFTINKWKSVFILFRHARNRQIQNYFGVGLVQKLRLRSQLQIQPKEHATKHLLESLMLHKTQLLNQLGLSAIFGIPHKLLYMMNT